MNRFLPSLSLRSAAGVLLFHWNGFRLRGGLYRRSEGQAVASAQVEAEATEIGAAIAEILQKIKRKGYSPPGRASLVAANSVIALLDLPVSPDKPRPAMQMQELIRWELEPLFAQHNDGWMVGALLEGLGYLTAEQRREVAVEAELAAAEAGRRRLVRFGELAVEKGFVTSAQIEDCLRLRDGLVVVDDDLACGWQGQGGGDDSEAAQGSWLACGIGREIRRRFQAAFRENRIALEWIYPQQGSGFALLPEPTAAGQSQLLVECQQEQLCLLAATGGALSTVRVEPWRERAVSAETIAEIAREELSRTPDQIWLLDPAGAGGALAEALAGLIGREVRSLAGADAELLGAASHLLGLAPDRAAVRLDGKEPKPPAWRNGDLLRVAAALLAVLVVGGTEYFQRGALESSKERLASLEEAFEEQLDLNKKLRSIATVTDRLAAQVDERSLEVAAAREELELYETVLIRRRSHVPRLLEAFRDSLNDEVVVDGINESSDAAGYFVVTAWSLTDTSAQLFTNQLDRALQALGLAVTDQRLRRASGRLGLEGYSIKMRLVPRPTDAAVASDSGRGEAGGVTQ